MDLGVDPNPWEMTYELQAIRVKPLPKNTCWKIYKDFSFRETTIFFSRGYNICIEGGGVCEGDSGGPLICEGIYH